MINTSCFRRIAVNNLKSSLVGSLLIRRKLIMPSLHIHNTLRRMNHLILIFWTELSLRYVINSFPLLVLSWLLSLNKQWWEASSFLCRFEVILQQLIHPLLSDIHIPLSILKVLQRSSLLLNLKDELLTLIVHQSKHHSPEELAFRKFLLLTMRIWKIL